MVLSEDGKLVNVDASLKLLNVTADPSKTGVRERWDAYRAGKSVTPPASVAAPAFSEPSERPPRPGDTSQYHQARTLREQTEAQIAQLELKRQLGEVLEAQSTLRGITDANVTACVAVLSLADRLAPLVAPEADVRKCYDLILVECKRIVQSVSEQMQKLRNSSAPPATT